MTTIPPPSEAVVVMDRFASASSSQDAIESLQMMLDGLKRDKNNNTEFAWEPDWILEHEDVADHLVWLLRHGTLKGNEIPCEEGVHFVCQLYQHLGKSSKALKLPRPGLLLESLLDVLDHSENPIYVRVLALKVMEALSLRHKSMAGSQWLQAPNGLHRLADILSIDVETNPLEEAVRDQALIVAKLLSKEAPIAKVFLFAEVECRLLDLCWSQGGLTKGNPIVIDALQLIQELLKHADSSLQDLVWQRPNVAPRLTQLLDLRGGEKFLHPKTKEKIDKQTTMKDDDDDLDSLLASGQSTKQLRVKQMEGTNDHPNLLASEGEVVQLVLGILRLLLETDSIKSVVWKSHGGLCSLVWELALINPTLPPVCALPKASLQQEALTLVAEKFNDPDSMARHSGLDRLLFLVCTGGGIAENFGERLGISQSALAVLRQTLSEASIHEILMRTLAPPPTIDESAPLPGPTVVQKLWNTVMENLGSDDNEQRTLFMSGALGGLSLMLCDEESREIMYKIAPISLDQLLESLYKEKEEIVQCAMLRLLCEWIFECPLFAHNLLRSTASTHLAGMAAASSSFQSLIYLLLGLAMEFMTNEQVCGGWTRAGILHVITKVGISKFTSSLEGLKTATNSKMPWTVSQMEYKSWKHFSSQAVLIVRKRVVEQLSGGNCDSEDDSDAMVDGSPSVGSSGGLKPLQKLIAQQAEEMDMLRRELEVSQMKVVAQQDQLAILKRRMESTPTELDDMLNEFTCKSAKLEELVQGLELKVKQLELEKQNAAQDSKEKLAKARADNERLQAQEREARDNLERTEQEMQALSQAYASLEEDYQRHQNRQGGGAPTGETSHQPEGEDSHQQTTTGSTEVATLRAENSRLRNDAQAADEWMAMAVQRMNEMGTANGELQRQVADLTEQLKTSAQNRSHDDANSSQERQMLEVELAQVRTLLSNTENELASLSKVQLELENEKREAFELKKRVEESESKLFQFEELHIEFQIEKEKCAQLDNLLAEARQDQTTLQNLRMDLQSEKQKTEIFEKRAVDAEERAQASANLLQEERNKRLEVEKKSNLSTSAAALEENDDEISSIEKLRAEYDVIVASKASEIETLKLSLATAEYQFNNVDDRALIEQVKDARKEIEEIQHKSQQDIYQLESIIRELKDRLGSGLGPYKVEDIRARNEEIDELRKANEAAQDWMAKAVEHHNVNAAQIAKLTEERAALSLQLEELRTKPSSKDTDQVKNIELALEEKTRALKLSEENFEKLQSEYKRLRDEMEAHQGLLDELGIAMDDVGVMRQKLLDSEVIITDLEAKLSGNILNKENEALKTANEDLENRISDLQSWTEMAQSKLAEIMTSKDNIERQLNETMQELESARVQSEKLKENSESQTINADELQQAREEIQILTQDNEAMRDERDRQEAEYRSLESRFFALQAAHDDAQQALLDLNEMRLEIEKEKEKTIGFVKDLEQWQAKNRELTDELEKLKSKDTTGGRDSFVIEEEGQDTKIYELLEELRRKDDELAAANAALVQDEEVVQQWEDRVIQLETELAQVKNNLQEQESEASNAIAKWQESYSASEERCKELEEHYKQAMDEKHLLESKLKSSEDRSHYPEKGIISDSDEIAKLREELKKAEETIACDKDVVQQWEERAAELAKTIQSLQAQIHGQEEEASNIVNQWQDSCAAAQQQCKILEEELGKWKQKEILEDNVNGKNKALANTLTQKEKEFQSLRQVVDESQSTVKKLEERLFKQEELLRDKESQLDSIVADLQTKLDKTDEKYRRLKNESEARIARKEDEIKELQARLDSRNSARNTEAVESLEKRVKDLEGQLEEERQEAIGAVAQWQESYTSLEVKYGALEKELANTNEIVASCDWTIEQLKASNETYCLQIEEYKTAIETKPSTEDDLLEIAAEISRLTDTLETERQIRIDERQELEAELAGERGRHAEARDEIDMLTTSLKEIKTESEDVVNQWTARYEELEKVFKDVSNQLEDQERDANEAIASWEQKAEELEKDLDIAELLPAQLKEVLGHPEEDKENVSTVIVDKVQQMINEKAVFEERMSHLQKIVAEKADRIDNLEKELKATELQLVDIEKQLEKAKEERSLMKQRSASKTQEKSEEDCKRLTIVIAQLEDELQEANEMVQAFVTDESTDKATAVAAQALREEIDELKAQLHASQKKYDDERAAREVADLEIERLRDDISALVSLSEQENTPLDLKKLTTKAMEKLQKRERAEIEDMRKSLFRAMEELEVVRTAEKESNEKVGKTRLQLSMYEQDIITAKSEINFLTQAMEEMRETAESKRASLEYRIGSLESENDVVRKYHAAEIEKIRNELLQITMERDRILHQLKESERTNSSLLVAASKGNKNEKENFGNIEAECSRLRVENAHLLTTAADDRARAERRLRELLAAQVASSEADVILEHELRLSAEAELQTLKLEMEELLKDKLSKDEPHGVGHTRGTEPSLSHDEIKKLKSSLENLQQENANLNSQMKREISAAEAKIEALTDECRKEQAKVHKLHREGRYEVAVQSEITRMRLASIQSPSRNLGSNGDWMSSQKTTVAEVLEPSWTSVEAFDLICKQKEEIQEERKVYREFLQEHDDLLALVAQQDFKISFLSDALLEVAGDHAVDNAIQRAREAAEQINAY